MRVRVQLFGMLGERAGRKAIEVDLPDGATVAEATGAIAAHDGLGELLERLPVVMAVNREYAPRERRLRSGDELALVPPVSGGAPVLHARVSAEPLSLDSVAERVGSPSAGAVVTFQGTTRDVDRLEHEAYVEMAEERMAAILRECVARHGLEAAAAEHRVGAVGLGEAGVVLAVSAAHRAEAFAGAREAIDRIKAEAPIWKREVERRGDVTRATWVDGVLPDPDPTRTGPERRVADPELTHLGGDGRARMVDVSTKPPTERRARAEALMRLSPQTAAAILDGDAPKGDVLGTARLAGIQAAKRTGELVPLAHPLPLAFVDVRARVDQAGGGVMLEAEVATVAATGVEMEAMTACTVAALTLYDMVKGIERGVVIERVRLLEKTGGKHDWRRAP
jgi:MoaE-MoaD fusion protein